MIGEYHILARKDQVGKEFVLDEFPELRIRYLGFENNLCPSNYENSVCIWEGDLAVTFSVNDKVIVINDHDSQKHKVNIVGQYIFQGLKPLVKHRSKDDTYLVFRVTKQTSLI